MFAKYALFAWAAVCLLAIQANRVAAQTPWQTDYRASNEEARTAHKLTLIWFFDPGDAEENSRFQADVLDQPAIAERIAATCVAVKLPLDEPLVVDGRTTKLLAHPAFSDLHAGPGVAIIDQRDSSSKHFGRVVSVFPHRRGPIAAEQLAVLLDLPAGSLTQRTLIFAVRTHRDRPGSADGGMLPLLAGEAEKHAIHQASIGLQGHHGWNQRFHSINARLPAGLVAYEVCSESWPGQSLVEAAEECVDSWRQSSGHWNQVSRQADHYGYDMQRGAGGVWYATGIFGRRR